MGSPPIVPVPPSGPTYIPSGPSSAVPSSQVTAQDSMSLYSFLQTISTAKDDHKHTIFDGQEVDAVVNKEYFLGVVQEISFLTQKYIKTKDYADAYADLVNQYNLNTASLNVQIQLYNLALNNLNNQISTMNDAINTINNIASPTPAQIATYNDAVTNFNQYLTLTGNPALANYANRADTFYNNPVNIANTVTIPEINALIDEISIGIPNVPLFSPSTAPVGGSPLPLQPNYSGAGIPLISPSSYPDLNNLNLLPYPPSQDDVIETYYLPFAEKFLDGMAAISKKLAGIDDYRAFINFILKQGFDLNPATINAFILNTTKPSLKGGTQAAGGTIGSLIVGIDSQNLERILSTALFNALAAQETIPIPPDVYDQINVFAISLLARVGGSAGLSVVKLLGEQLKSLKPDNPAIDLALAAAILQNILKVVEDSKATLESLIKILKEVPGITEEQAKALAEKLLTAQNTSLLLFGGLSTAASLRNPNLVPRLLNTTFERLNINNEFISSDRSVNIITDDNDTIIRDNPFSPQSVNNLLKEDNRVTGVKTQLSNRLKEETKYLKSPIDEVANSSIDNTISNLPPNANVNTFRDLLNEELKKQGLNENQARSISESSKDFISQQLNPSAENLTKELRENIQSIIKADATRTLSEAVQENIVKNITDVTNPFSLVSQLENHLDSLVQLNDQKVDRQIVKLLREFQSPQIDTFVLLEKLKNPAHNILHSFMTGLMYDRAIPTNWQRPLSIQV